MRTLGLGIMIALAACSSSGDSSSDGGGGNSDASCNRFLGTWSSCTFARRLQYDMPSGTPDRYMSVTGSLEVTDNGDGTIKLTPTATGITNCVLDFTPNMTCGASANAVPDQTCVDDMLTLTFAYLSDVDVSTGELAASFVETFTGTYMTMPASGMGGGTYHCTR